MKDWRLYNEEKYEMFSSPTAKRAEIEEMLSNVSVFSMITNRVQHKLGGAVKDMTEN